MAAAERRHRSSLQGIIDFADLPPLADDRRAKAKSRLYSILTHFEPAESNTSKYNRPALARLTYEYARSDESRDIFVRAFFECMQLRLDDDDVIDFTDNDVEKRLHSAVLDFADLLLENFFLPSQSYPHCQFFSPVFSMPANSFYSVRF